MLNLHEPAPAAKPLRVLVVEDDAVNRTFLHLALRKRGYQVVPVEDVAAARRQFGGAESDRFDCVVSDYWMPGQTGLDLLRWLKENDPSLATIILTAEGEKTVLTELIRFGAADFLEKPVVIPNLVAALERAASQTARRRQLFRSDSALKKLGRKQRWMVQSGGSDYGNMFVDVCFHPQTEAGGDFLGHFQTGPDTHCCLLSDVSGHDLEAAYISAYFHGIFHGMLLRAAPLTEIFGHFNDFLVHDWNRAEPFRDQTAIGTSLAASALLINTREQTARAIICGAPAPFFVSPDGRAIPLGDQDGPPLGWFPNLELRASIHSIAGGGTIYLWTDGLADLAEALGVHPLCLSFALREARQKSGDLSLLEHAKDDILSAALYLPASDLEIGLLHPILVQHYRGDQAAEIDTLEAHWRRNLKLAAPEISDQCEHDILLAMREAVLNAMRHGCQRQADKSLRLQMSYHHGRHAIRIWVEDPGAGHQFDFAAHADNAEQELIDAHRGLMLIMHLSSSVRIERNGATLILEFQL